MKARGKLQFTNLNGSYMTVSEQPNKTKSTTLNMAVEILKHFEVH